MTNKKLFSIGFITIALLCSGVEVGSAASLTKATLWVSATVMPWFNAQAIQQTESYQVTREDITKGYTDLFAAVSLQIQTNMTHGKILLQVANSGTEQVLVKAAGTVSDQLSIDLTGGSPLEKHL